MSFYLAPIHIVAGVTLAANTVYYYLLRKWRFPLLVSIVSTAIDMIIITVLVYYTGGLSSMFFLLYLVQILGVSLFLNLTFSALMILWAMILIGVMGALETAGLVAPSATFVPTAHSDFLNTVVWFIFQAMALCLVAFLDGNLSNKLKFKERELKQKMEMEKLYEALRKADEQKRWVERDGGEGIGGEADRAAVGVGGGDDGYAGQEGAEGITQGARVEMGGHAAVSSASQSARAALTATGAVIGAMWPWFATTSARPRGAAAAISRAIAGVELASSAPVRNSAGWRTSGQPSA